LTRAPFASRTFARGRNRSRQKHRNIRITPSSVKPSRLSRFDPDRFRRLLFRQHIRYVSLMSNRDRYLNASEINTYVFCQRAWYLERNGARSLLTVQRAAGTAVHARAKPNRRLAIGLGIVGVVLLIAALVLR
jgi:hypothetical protein